MSLTNLAVPSSSCNANSNCTPAALNRAGTGSLAILFSLSQ